MRLKIKKKFVDYKTSNWTESYVFVIFKLLLYRVLLKQARKLAQQYYLTYQEQIPTGQLVQRVATVMQEYTQSGYESF